MSSMHDRIGTYSQSEIDGFANKLIDEFGGRAGNYVAATIALMKDRGDIESTYLWKRIHGAVGRLSIRHGDSPALTETRRGVG